MDAAARGLAAIEAKNFDVAISEYSNAISDSPKAVTYYLKRCIAYCRSSQLDKGLADAETAVVLARERAKRELIGEAQMRRGIALYNMERYGDAKVCFAQARLLAPKEKQLPIWELKAKGKLDPLDADDEKRKVTVKEVPDVDIQGVVKAAKNAGKGKAAPKTEDVKKAAATSAAEPLAATTNSSTPAQPTMVQTPPSKIRHEWYQSASTITLSLMVKGVPKDKATIDIQPGSLTISFPLPTGSDYEFSLDPLFARIDPQKSSSKIMGTKIELTLKKAEEGKKWHVLEGTEAIDDVSSSAQGDTDNANIKKAVLAPTESVPSYPTSSKHGPKNWDKIAQNLSKKKPAAESSKSKPKSKAGTSSSSTADPAPSSDNDSDSDDDNAKEQDEELTYNSDDDEGGDPTNKFFKTLFKNADPDTRRAMMKSYTESNGTALSTNWAEVSKGPVETKPPDGMEAKKYE